MIETIGNVFTYGPPDAKIARVIPTNGETNAAGRAIMGKGVALQAATRYRDLPASLGALILSHGNRVHELLMEDGSIFVSFPTKGLWWKPADLKLIERSARQLLSLLNDRSYDMIVMPRPGVGNGQLTWDKVRPKLEKVFKNEDRIIILSITDPTDPNPQLSKRWR